MPARVGQLGGGSMRGSEKFVGLATACALAGCSAASLDTYDMPVAQTYEKLAEMDLEDVEGPFEERHAIKLTRKENESLRWKSTETGMIDCVANLSAVDTARTRVAVSCNGVGQMPGWIAKQARADVIEKIDSTLRGRPYDKKNAPLTASRYPADVVKHAGFAQEFGQAYAGSVKQAFETQREIAQMERELREEQATRQPVSTLDFQKPGEPSLKLD
jgi:hypothetical protein